MRSRPVLAALALAAFAAAPAAAQTGEALLKSMASYTPVKNLTFPVPASDAWRLGHQRRDRKARRYRSSRVWHFCRPRSRGPALQHKLAMVVTLAPPELPRTTPAGDQWTARTSPSSRPSTRPGCRSSPDDIQPETAAATAVREGLAVRDLRT
jgi:hypothetical protein